MCTTAGADPGISKRGRGGAQSWRGRILSTKVCFDAPSHIPYVFVRRVVNNIHIVNTACWPKSKYLRIYNENLQKQVPCFFSNGEGTPPSAPVLDPPLQLCMLTHLHYLVYDCQQKPFISLTAWFSHSYPIFLANLFTPCGQGRMCCLLYFGLWSFQEAMVLVRLFHQFLSSSNLLTAAWRHSIDQLSVWSSLLWALGWL